MNKELEMAKEVARIYLEITDYSEALTKVEEMYKKVQTQATTQGNEHTKTFNDIIPLGTDLDNGEVYNESTGETVKEL